MYPDRSRRVKTLTSIDTQAQSFYSGQVSSTPGASPHDLNQLSSSSISSPVLEGTQDGKMDSDDDFTSDVSSQDFLEGSEDESISDGMYFNMAMFSTADLSLFFWQQRLTPSQNLKITMPGTTVPFTTRTSLSHRRRLSRLTIEDLVPMTSQKNRTIRSTKFQQYSVFLRNLAPSCSGICVGIKRS